MKRNCKCFCIITLLFVVFGLVIGCSNMISTNEVVAKDKVRVKLMFSVGSSNTDNTTSEARAVGDISTEVVPTPLTAGEISTFILKGTKSGGAEQTLGTWTAAAAIGNAVIEIERGTWSFTMSAVKNDLEVLSSTIQLDLNETIQVLNFALQPVTTGNGSINMKLLIPHDRGIDTTDFKLLTFPANTEYNSKVNTVTPSVTTGFDEVNYSLSDVPCGKYLLNASIKNGNTICTVYSMFLKVVPGCNTTSTRTIDEEDLNLGTRPSKPTAIIVTEQTTDSVTLSWAASENSEKYYVYYSTASTSASALKFNTSFSGSEATITGTITGLLSNTFYYFWIKGFNGEYSLFSDCVRAKTYNNPPEKPVNLKATDIHTTSITLNWDKVTDATTYKIYKCTSTNKATAALYTTVDTNSVVINNLTKQTNYFYCVEAVNTAGEVSPKSDVFTVETASFETGFVSARTPTTLVLQWEAVTGAESYNVYKNTINDSTTATLYTSTTDNTVTVSSLTSATQYYFWISSYSTEGGESAFSPCISGVTMLEMPSLVIYKTQTLDSVTLNWTAVTSAEKYIIYRNTTADKATAIKVGETTLTTYTTSGLEAGRNEGIVYYFWCTAKSELAGESDKSFTLMDDFVLIDGDSTDDFYIGKYEVTQQEWELIMGTNPSNFSSSPTVGEIQARRPVESISWYEVLVYCNKLSIAQNLTPCYSINNSTNPTNWGSIPTTNNTTWNAVTCSSTANGYKLPTKTQWQYVANGGINKNTYTYSGSSTISGVAWYKDNSSGRTHQVGLKAPNTLGIYDMSGNVREWCWSLYSSTPRYYYLSGGYSSPDSYNTCTYSFYDYPYCKYCNVGFRLIRSAE